MRQVSLMIIMSVFSLAACAQQDDSAVVEGESKRIDEARFEVWNERVRTWQTPEQFWEAYAQRGRGKYWGKLRDYPPYEEVNEFDTLIIELDSGVCLMEFFHRRWRRANDVRRWNDVFNDYGGCPRVFD